MIVLNNPKIIEDHVSIHFAQSLGKDVTKLIRFAVFADDVCNSPQKIKPSTRQVKMPPHSQPKNN